MHLKWNRRKVLPQGSGRLRDPAVGKTLRKSVYPFWIKSLPRGGAEPELLPGAGFVPLCSSGAAGRDGAGLELHLQQQQRIPLQRGCDSVPMNHSATLLLNQILGFIIVRAGGKGGREEKRGKKKKSLQCFISLSNSCQFSCLKI